MPFKSEAQRRYLFSQKPEVAKEFAAKTPPGTKLPEHVAKTNKSKGKEEGMTIMKNSKSIKKSHHSTSDGYMARR
jgi:hypothetical protein